MTAATCDPRALSVARAVHQRERPHATILFGSRARGDHDEYRSDIDIMLVQPEEPDGEYKGSVAEWMEGVVEETYGRRLPVQLVWPSQQRFLEGKRYVNHVTTRAMLEGVVISRHPEQYRSRYAAAGVTEFEYDWTIYDNRMLYAESNLTAFEDTIDLGSPDLIVGFHAQAALKYGLKALLEAHSVVCRSTYDIAYLLERIRKIDPGMREFNVSLPPDIYTEYDWTRDYGLPRRQLLLTDQPDYRQRTAADAQRIINRAREVRQGRTD